MTTINKVDDKYLVLTKGACDRLVKNCKYINELGQKREITNSDIKKILDKNDEYSQQAYRVLGFAYQETDDYKSMNLESNLIFIGLVAMIDPPRDEVKDAIALCNKAGIRVMMITGDHLGTAKAIATELGILKPGHIALSGEETSSMSDKQYEDAILRCDVFARSTPKDKLKIVNILQKHGEIVAMTGDGVNDAPALKQANIGVAMGISGSEVSKEASNMILTDDNFASIVSAVKEGRIIYNNIQKFTVYLISCNIGEIFIILFAMLFSSLFNSLIPLLAIHLLWINLMTDSFPAFALGLEENDEDIMDKRPINAKQPILNKPTLLKIVIQGLGLAIAALSSFYIGLNLVNVDITQARTMIFITVICGELFRTYSSRSETRFLFDMNPFSNKYINYSVLISIALLMLIIYIPPVAALFSIKALTTVELIIAIILGFIPMLLSEIFKAFNKTNYESK
jgi:Ca2+-transporting ATPase